MASCQRSRKYISRPPSQTGSCVIRLIGTWYTRQKGAPAHHSRARQTATPRKRPRKRRDSGRNRLADGWLRSRAQLVQRLADDDRHSVGCHHRRAAGLGGANGVAILLPLTFSMPPTSAIIMLSCIYWGALFGGAITSILFNIPGEPWSVATTFDGHPMAQKGRADEALNRGLHLVVRRRTVRGHRHHLPGTRGRQIRACASDLPNSSPCSF